MPLVHLSTDYVFDGKKSGAYVENDPIAPLSVYGRTKAEGEAAVREAQPHHVILRTSWVYGVHGKNFLKTVLRLASERDEFTMVADQFGCPTATADIAEAIVLLAPRLVADANVSGTYHFAGTGRTSWHGFATEIVARQRPFTGRNPRVVPIATGGFQDRGAPAGELRPRQQPLPRDLRTFRAPLAGARRRDGRSAAAHRARRRALSAPACTLLADMRYSAKSGCVKLWLRRRATSVFRSCRFPSQT